MMRRVLVTPRMHHCQQDYKTTYGEKYRFLKESSKHLGSTQLETLFCNYCRVRSGFIAVIFLHGNANVSLLIKELYNGARTLCRDLRFFS